MLRSNFFVSGNSVLADYKLLDLYRDEIFLLLLIVFHLGPLKTNVCYILDRFYNFIYLFIFGCAGSLIAVSAFSGCRE